MLNKQNLWFITLFSLILILGIYYVTIPNDVLEKVQKKVIKEEQVVAKVEESSPLTALRVSKENSRKEKIESLENALTNEKLSTEEKNNTYELLKYYNSLQGKEENYEKKLKKEFNLDCFTKIDNSSIDVVCISNEHDKTLANKIMRSIQEEYKDKMNIIVKFQKK